MEGQTTNNTLRCTTCGDSSVIQIELKLPDGSEVVFCSCHRCESKWWDRDGEHLDLDALVEVTRREQ
ncbi:MAG: hypothetical protein ABFS21_05110 [Actinomycetota bacterium]